MRRSDSGPGSQQRVELGEVDAVSQGRVRTSREQLARTPPDDRVRGLRDGRADAESGRDQPLALGMGSAYTPGRPTVRTSSKPWAAGPLLPRAEFVSGRASSWSGLTSLCSAEGTARACRAMMVRCLNVTHVAVPGGRAFYLTERLWELAAGLPVESVPIDTIKEFDEDCWFGGAPVTCRMVAQHADRIQKADLRYPVILSADGRLMDGGQRVAKAWLSGTTTIDAVRFSADPEPDYIERDSAG